MKSKVTDGVLYRQELYLLEKTNKEEFNVYAVKCELSDVSGKSVLRA